MEGLSGSAADRAVLPFPSHEIDPYRGLAPHVGVTSARARALHAIGSRHRPRRRRVSFGPDSADQRSPAAARRRARFEAGPGDRADGSGRTARRCRIHPRGSGGRTRRIRGARRHRRHLSGRRVTACPARIRRRHDRVDSSLRRRDPAFGRVDRSDRHRADCRMCCRSERGHDTSRSIGTPPFSTISACATTAGSSFPSATRSMPRAIRLLEQLQQSHEDALARKQRPLTPGDCSPTGRRSARLNQGDSIWWRSGWMTSSMTARGAGPGAADHPRPEPARRGDARERRRLGCRHPPPARRRRDDAVRRGDCRPRRTNIELLKEYEVLAVPVDRADDAQLRRGSRATGILSADSACQPPGCTSMPKPTSSRKSVARPSADVRPPRRFYRISAISR